MEIINARPVLGIENYDFQSLGPATNYLGLNLTRYYRDQTEILHHRTAQSKSLLQWLYNLIRSYLDHNVICYYRRQASLPRGRTADFLLNSLNRYCRGHNLFCCYWGPGLLVGQIHHGIGYTRRAHVQLAYMVFGVRLLVNQFPFRAFYCGHTTFDLGHFRN